MLSTRRSAALVLAATLFGMAVTAAMGHWQLSRAAQKIALQDEIEARGSQPVLVNADLSGDERLQYRPARLRGRWQRGHDVFLDNRQTATGRVGFFLVTPLLLEGRKDAILVQRGWVPRDQNDRTRLPPVATPEGIVEVSGRLAPPPARLYEFSASTGGVIRQNLDLAPFEAETGLQLLPLSLQQTGAAADGLLRDWPRPAVDVQKHYGYAFQWFAMCALMAGLYVWFRIVRPWRQRRARA